MTEEPSFHGKPECCGSNYAFKPIDVCSFYRPPNTCMDPIIEFKCLLNDIFTHNSDSARIILAGNFNLPDIHWEEGLGHFNPSPVLAVYGHELNSLFVGTMNDYDFEQLVNAPTRENHILDLVFI